MKIYILEKEDEIKKKNETGGCSYKEGLLSNTIGQLLQDRNSLQKQFKENEINNTRLQEQLSMQQHFDESRDSNTCEQNRQQQPNDNLQLRSKLERTKRREKSLERQLDLQLARIAMVRTGIQQIIRNKTASNSVLSIARLIEQNTLSDVKEEHPIRLKTEFVCKNEYVELFIKEEKYQEEEDTNVEYKDTSQPAEIIPNHPHGDEYDHYLQRFARQE